MSQFTLVKPGADAHNPRLTDIIISRDYSNPKIWTKGPTPHAGIIYLNWSSSLIIPKSTTKLIDSFAHTFNYRPTAFATFKFDNGSTKREGTLPFQYGALGIITIDTDSTNLNLKYLSTDLGSTTIPAFTMQIRYYLMVERGQ